MERLGRRMTRQRGTHRCGGGWRGRRGGGEGGEGAASHCCSPSTPSIGEEEGRAGKG